MVWKETRLLSNKAVGGQKYCKCCKTFQFLKFIFKVKSLTFDLSLTKLSEEFQVMEFYFNSPILDLFHGFSVILPPGSCLAKPFTPENLNLTPKSPKSVTPMSHIRLLIFTPDESGSVHFQFSPFMSTET